MKQLLMDNEAIALESPWVPAIRTNSSAVEIEKDASVYAMEYVIGGALKAKIGIAADIKPVAIGELPGSEGNPPEFSIPGIDSTWVRTFQPEAIRIMRCHFA